MSTSHFDRALLPPARSFYQAELGELRRADRKGWARPKSGCPFHASESKKSFFVNVDSGGFYCFGCDAKGGDVLAFVRLRYQLDFKAAAKELGALRGPLDAPERRRIARERKQRERELADQQARREEQRRERMELRDQIHSTNQLMKQISHDLQKDQSNESLWRCLELTWEYRELEEQEYTNAAGLGTYV